MHYFILSAGDEQQLAFEKLTGIERGLKDGLMKTEIFDENIFSCRKCPQPSKY